jgi:hypothetical protein
MDSSRCSPLSKDRVHKPRSSENLIHRKRKASLRRDHVDEINNVWTSLPYEENPHAKEKTPWAANLV